MRPNSTHIPIRRRSFLELIDLSLHLFVRHAGMVAHISLRYVLPFVVLDLCLCWHASFQEDEASVVFFVLPMLVILQAPWATAALTYYLGRVMFNQTVSLADLRKEMRANFGTLFLIHGIYRLALLGTLCALAARLSGTSEASGIWYGLTTIFGLAAIVIRSLRPFVNEMLLLERVPLRATATHAIPMSRRHLTLHGTNGSLILARAVATGVVAAILLSSVQPAGWFFLQLFLGPSATEAWAMTLLLSLSLWIVAIFTTIVRFVSYLDTRIRHEGWEIQLLSLAAIESLDPSVRR